MSLTALRRHCLFILLLSIWLPDPALADQEASNRPLIQTDKWGRCYAKSVPKHVYDPRDEPRQQGATRTYLVTAGNDALVDEYDWHSGQLFVACRFSGKSRLAPDGTLLPEVFVVRMGPWSRGHEPRADHLALGFYAGGETLKTYSTLDIAGGREVQPSVSHYAVFKWSPAPRLNDHGTQFAILTQDGRKLTFSVETGELLSTESNADSRSQ